MGASPLRPSPVPSAAPGPGPAPGSAAARAAAQASGRGATYAGAGVDLVAGEESVAKVRSLAASTVREGVREGIGGFAGLFALDTDRYRRPVLVSSTDGVGTKMLVAKATGRYESVGVDLVAMCVDDVVCVGAEPLFLLDYVAVGRMVPARVEAIVSGVARGCLAARCALVGGETAEHPGSMGEDDVDLAGFAVGAVEAGEELGAHRVRAGDVLIGLTSPGLRSNGYSLARHVLLDRAGLSLDEPAWEGAPHSLADELLRPSVVYTPAVLGAVEAGIEACAHITGGGIPGNLARILPPGTDARLDRHAWEQPEIFGQIARIGDVDDAEMARVFNLGLGFVVVARPKDAGVVLDSLSEVAHRTEPDALGGSFDATVVGEVVQGSGKVHL